jgi:hypothetical protein
MIDGPATDCVYPALSESKQWVSTGGASEELATENERRNEIMWSFYPSLVQNLGSSVIQLKACYISSTCSVYSELNKLNKSQSDRWDLGTARVEQQNGSELEGQVKHNGPTRPVACHKAGYITG